MKPVLLLGALAACACAQTYRIAGVLVDGRNGKPLARGHITLTGGRESMAVTTTADGAFAFDVPQGKYGLVTEIHDWHLTYGYSGPALGFGSSIITGPEQDTAHLIDRWYPPGSIYGKVTDDHGEPIENASVQAIREWVSGGKKVTTVAWTSRTDDRGSYRLGPLWAGTYYLVATAVPWYAGNLNTFISSDASLNMAYATTYYPGSTDVRQAGRLVLESGGDTQANLTMQAVPAVTVHPECSVENCAGSVSFYSVGVGGVETLVTTSYFTGDHPIHGIAPGHYVVRLTGAQSMRKVVDLAGGEATLPISPQAPPKITGVVTYKNGTKPKGAPYVSMVNETTNTSVGLVIGADGSFVYAYPPVGRFHPVIAATGYFITHVAASGADINDGSFDLVEGGLVHLDIEASDDSGRVRGLVKNGDKAVPAVMVVLAARDAAGSNILARGFQTDSDGSFDFTNVPAGDYLLFSCDKMDLEYRSADAIRPYLGSAIALHLEGHQTQTQNLSFEVTQR
jgi:hypothetical protein